MPARGLITGATGFLGKYVCQQLLWAAQAQGRGSNVDLCQPDHIETLLTWSRATFVIHLAYPGSRGITTSVEEPFSLAANLLRMDTNVIEACAKAKVEKLLCVGSVCAYPEHTTLPTDESQLWHGYPEPVNAAFGCAKRMQGVLLQAARQEYGLCGIQVILANLYGPGDRSGHVIPSLIRKIRKAERDGGPVVVWGEPEVTRSFLYVEDAAEGLRRALEAYESPEPLNLCTTEETSMASLVKALAGLLSYTGRIQYDPSQSTGYRRRRFSNERCQQALGWVPSTPLAEGLAKTVAWHLETEAV